LIYFYNISRVILIKQNESNNSKSCNGSIITPYLDSNEWYLLETHNDAVVQKSQYHCLVVFNNRIYICAGTQLIGGTFNLDNRICYLDLSKFNYNTDTYKPSNYNLEENYFILLTE